MSPVASVDILQVINVVEIILSRTVSEINFFFSPFYAEIQDSRQKWWEKDFGRKVPVDSADTLGVKNFVKIAPFRTIFKVNVF